MKVITLSFCCLLMAVGFSSCKKETPTEPAQGPNPVVKIVSPSSTTILQDSVNVQVDATDDKGVVKVEIYIDDQIPDGGSVLHAPYSYTWNLSSYPDSSVHTLYAKAYDADGNVTSTPVLTLVIFKFAPTNLTATVVSDSLIRLGWRDNSSKETGFEVERRINAGDFSLLKTVGANVTSADAEGIYKIGDSISFRVRAIKADSKSKYSNTVAASVVFPSPDSLKATLVDENQVILKWRDNSTFEQAFQIEEAIDGGSFIVVASVGQNVITSRVQGSFLRTSRYSFRVKAVSRYNSSNYSSVIRTYYSEDLYAAGAFTMANVQGQKMLARWNGTAWTAPIEPNAQGIAYAAAIYNGEVYLGGDFGGFYQVQGNICRWNGITYAGIGSGADKQISSLYVFNNELYIGGSFTSFAGSPAKYVAKWNGSSVSPVGSGNTPPIWAMTTFRNELYAGGLGGSYVDSLRYLFKLAGAGWSNVSKFPGDIYCLCVYNNDLYVGGNFSKVGNISANYIARFDGNSWYPVGNQIYSFVRSLTVFNNQICAGGEFSLGPGIVICIANWNGSSWSPIGAGISGSNAWHLSVWDSQLHVGGSFSKAGSISANCIARWDGSNWASFADGLKGEVHSIFKYACWSCEILP